VLKEDAPVPPSATVTSVIPVTEPPVIVAEVNSAVDALTSVNPAEEADILPDTLRFPPLPLI
jgi:hypothetical protein